MGCLTRISTVIGWPATACGGFRGGKELRRAIVVAPGRPEFFFASKKTQPPPPPPPADDLQLLPEVNAAALHDPNRGGPCPSSTLPHLPCVGAGAQSIGCGSKGPGFIPASYKLREYGSTSPSIAAARYDLRPWIGTILTRLARTSVAHGEGLTAWSHKSVWGA
jgi:hypothetical protein